jgi:DNA-binding CsgD family transcriptional regulator
MMLELFNTEASKILKRLSDSEGDVDELLRFELEFYKKLLVFFQIGESCYLIFNFQKAGFDFVGGDVGAVLGYEKEEVTPDLLTENVHPEERTWLLNAQATASQFIWGVPPDRQMKYKMRFDYRIRKKDGHYVRVMQQAVVILNNSTGKVLKTLIMLTDISHLKRTGSPVLSYVGIEGEPSFLNVDVKRLFPEKDSLLSKREKEVLFHLAEGMLTKEIANLLYISKHTVDNHRKNLLRKLEVANTGELVSKAIKEGLI